jgi:hypothetical protein
MSQSKALLIYRVAKIEIGRGPQRRFHWLTALNPRHSRPRTGWQQGPVPLISRWYRQRWLRWSGRHDRPFAVQALRRSAHAFAWCGDVKKAILPRHAVGSFVAMDIAGPLPNTWDASTPSSDKVQRGAGQGNCRLPGRYNEVAAREELKREVTATLLVSGICPADARLRSLLPLCFWPACSRMLH